MSIPQTLRGWTFVTNPGTASEAVSKAQTAVPFDRPQIKSLDDIVTVFNRFVQSVAAATLGARSVPFGAGGTVLLGAKFTSGQTLMVPHRLGTAACSAIFACPTAGAAPAAVASFDANVARFAATATWTGDVYILVTAA